MTWLKRPAALLRRWEKDRALFLARCWGGAGCVRVLGNVVGSRCFEGSGCGSGGLGRKKKVC